MLIAETEVGDIKYRIFSKTRSTSCWRDLILLTLVSVGEGQAR